MVTWAKEITLNTKRRKVLEVATIEMEIGRLILGLTDIIEGKNSASVEAAAGPKQVPSRERR